MCLPLSKSLKKPTTSSHGHPKGVVLDLLRHRASALARERIPDAYRFTTPLVHCLVCSCLVVKFFFPLTFTFDSVSVQIFKSLSRIPENRAVISQIVA